VRITSIRSTYWLTAIAVLFGTGLSFVVAMGFSFSLESANPPTAEDLQMVAPALVNQFAAFGVPYFAGYLIAMIAVFAWGHEYRHGMVRATLTAISSRPASWLAKVLVVGVWTLGAVLLLEVLAVLSGFLWLADDGVDLVRGATFEAAGRTLLYALLLSWLATAFTSLVRNQTAALVLLFLWPLAIENVITLVFELVPQLDRLAPATRFLPFNAAGRILIQTAPGGGPFGDPLSLVGGLVVFGLLTVGALVASLVLFRRRDA
jgi:ABC-type transport system involved in multi-copper enzyme maturation permease subunit